MQSRYLHPVCEYFWLLGGYHPELWWECRCLNDLWGESPEIMKEPQWVHVHCQTIHNELTLSRPTTTLPKPMTSSYPKRFQSTLPVPIRDPTTNKIQNMTLWKGPAAIILSLLVGLSAFTDADGNTICVDGKATKNDRPTESIEIDSL